MYTIGTIGSGSVGTVIARLSIRARHSVVMSNRRGPNSLVELVQAFGPFARAATAAEAADAADIVVVAVPLSAYKNVPVDRLRGKIVIDANNYYPDRDGHIDELDTERMSSSELLQRHLPTRLSSRPSTTSPPNTSQRSRDRTVPIEVPSQSPATPRGPKRP
jgi:predicted dinucleotide-binding enzyme